MPATEPNHVAVSDDGQFLYVGLDAASQVQRYTLPGLVPDVTIPLGSSPVYGAYLALDLQVAPGQPHTVAMSVGIGTLDGGASAGGVALFDDAVPRPNRISMLQISADTIQWSANAQAVLMASTEGDFNDLAVAQVDANGLTLGTTFPELFVGCNSYIHRFGSNPLIFADSGMVVNPVRLAPLGSFQTDILGGSRMTLTNDKQRAIFLGVGDYAYGGGGGTFGLSTFDVATYLADSAITEFTALPDNGDDPQLPLRLITCGPAVLAWGGSSSPVYVMSGPFVTGN
jgi:hypothetical protein